MNYSELTRREQVLAYLLEHRGEWVDGPELANEKVGGSEGLKRLRELRQEGQHDIRMRKHPDPDRDIWQYQLMPSVAHGVGAPISHAEYERLTQFGSDDWAAKREEDAERLESITTEAARYQGSVPEVINRPEHEQTIFPSEPPAYPKTEPVQQQRMGDAVKRKEDGTYEYVPPQRAIIEQLTTPPDPPQPPGYKFESMPKSISWGTVAVCPSCKSKTRRGSPPKEDPNEGLQQTASQRRRKAKAAPKLVDDDGILLFRDAHSKEVKPCSRCNGYGIVPNQGPIPLTAP